MNSVRGGASAGVVDCSWQFGCLCSSAKGEERTHLELHVRPVEVIVICILEALHSAAEVARVVLQLMLQHAHTHTLPQLALSTNLCIIQVGGPQSC